MTAPSRQSWLVVPETGMQFEICEAEVERVSAGYSVKKLGKL
jgi:hypothetical protein